ncbi:hypothetical protein CDAR_25931 [Caerostris darwini]|uniref:Uncharacterized protein n=1 Tax=Caerostris darwini TaxID=1538125 RepID=A0AAV4PJM7_9ARAC|nr:hypothetical protein CDAR_25931 [Caerostris darwini]
MKSKLELREMSTRGKSNLINVEDHFTSFLETQWMLHHIRLESWLKHSIMFDPKRDGPHMILTHKFPTMYIVSRIESLEEPIGFHILYPVQNKDTQTVVPLRK